MDKKQKLEWQQKWNQKIKECDTYAMCSTLNEIVNYIPLQYIETHTNTKELKLYRLTYKESENKGEKEPNKSWTKNFEKVFNETLSNTNATCINYNKDNFIYFARVFDQEDYKKQLEKIKGEHIIWNITGGQRNIVFSILKVLQSLKAEEEKQRHTVLYLEGNTQKMIGGIYDSTKRDWVFQEVDESYGDSELKLGRVFQLAGFYINKEAETLYLGDKKNKDANRNQDFENKMEACSKFYHDCYLKNNELDKNILKELIQTNKDSTDYTNIINTCDLDEKYKNIILKFVGDSKHKPNKSIKAFGYLLEYMTASIICEVVNKIDKNHKFFNSLSHSVKIINKEREDTGYNGGTQFCELDLVLLTKAGQIIVFECKSGRMESDTAKAREYTTYALGGVYGTPILITPLPKNEIVNINKEKDSIVDNIRKAVNAADRGNLSVWGLDEIEEKLIQLFEDTNQLKNENIERKS